MEALLFSFLNVTWVYMVWALSKSMVREVHNHTLTLEAFFRDGTLCPASRSCCNRNSQQGKCTWLFTEFSCLQRPGPMYLGFAPGDGRVVLSMQPLPAVVTDPLLFQDGILKLRISSLRLAFMKNIVYVLSSIIKVTSLLRLTWVKCTRFRQPQALWDCRWRTEISI